MLLKKQRNVFLEILLNKGLSTGIISEFRKPSSYQIQVKGSSYHFTVHPAHSTGSVMDGDFIIVSSPKSAGRGWVDSMFWSDVVDRFTKWVSAMREELDTPDLWAEATKTAQLFAGTTDASDDKFTRHELAEVQGQLRQLQQSFSAAALPEPARQKLIELTQTAAVKAEGLTKKDWQNWIIGGFISSITSLALNPTQAGEVLKLVKAAFGGLFLH